MSFSELENDTLNQTESNEIQIKENNQIFEVPGQKQADLNFDRRKPTVAFTYRIVSVLYAII